MINEEMNTRIDELKNDSRKARMLNVSVTVKGVASYALFLLLKKYLKYTKELVVGLDGYHIQSVFIALIRELNQAQIGDQASLLSELLLECLTKVDFKEKNTKQLCWEPKRTKRRRCIFSQCSLEKFL